MIKRFSQFVYESKFDTISLSVARDLFSFVKSTKGTQVGKILKTEFEYSEPIEFDVFFVVKRVVSFNPSKTKHFKSLPWEVFNFEETGFSLDANVYIPNVSEPESPVLEMVLYISPEAEPLAYENLNRKLLEYLRHEIEHLLQKGVNRREGHEITTREKTRRDAETSYRYFLLPDEIPAMVAGMHASAAKKRVPIDTEFNLYLQPFLRAEMITQAEYQKVMRAWINFAKKVYPDSKFSNKVY